MSLGGGDLIGWGKGLSLMGCFLLKVHSDSPWIGGTGHDPFPLPFLLLHPSVLEPDLHLSVIQLEGVSNLYAPGSGQVFVKMKFFLQFCKLFGGEVCPHCAGRIAHSIFRR